MRDTCTLEKEGWGSDVLLVEMKITTVIIFKNVSVLQKIKNTATTMRYINTSRGNTEEISALQCCTIANSQGLEPIVK